MDLNKLSKPWKKAMLYLSPEFAPQSVVMPDGVEVVQVVLKLYGEGLPESFRSKEGKWILSITLDELAELKGKTTCP